MDDFGNMNSDLSTDDSSGVRCYLRGMNLRPSASRPCSACPDHLFSIVRRRRRCCAGLISERMDRPADLSQRFMEIWSSIMACALHPR